MVKNNTATVVGVIIILIALFFLFGKDGDTETDTTQILQPQTTLNPFTASDLFTPVRNPDSIMRDPITPQQKELIEVNIFPRVPLLSVTQSSGLFIVAEPSGSGDWCCSGSCNYQCSGSFDFCDNWCDGKGFGGEEEEIATCPSGTVPIVEEVGKRICCPTEFPNYCSSVDTCYKDSNLCPTQTFNTPTGCPEAWCTIASYPDISDGSVLYQPIGTDSTYNCFNKFGDSPTGAYYTAPGTACCFTARTGGERGSSGGSGINPLGILCSDRVANAPDSCTQLGSVAICYVKDQCSTVGLQCVDDLRFQTCKQVSGKRQGVTLAPFNELSESIFACGVEERCSDNSCKISICGENEVKLTDGSCRVLKQTCIDNNLNNICDLDDPIIWVDPDNNVPICADRNGDQVCDGVESLFCKDSNKNQICDSDETKWLITHCEDINGNGICDGIENERTDCSLSFEPVCDTSTDITYPSKCFADAFNVVETTVGACDVQPTIIRRDCATGDVPIPSGYICDFETGWLFKREEIYQNITIDCRTSSPLEGFTCTQVGSDWVWTRTELVEIDCFSLGCPKENQICQAGICLESQERCPDQLNCQDTFGENAVCDGETGLCVGKQFFPVQLPSDISSDILVEGDKGVPTVLIVVGIMIGLFVLLKIIKII